MRAYASIRIAYAEKRAYASICIAAVEMYALRALKTCKWPSECGHDASQWVLEPNFNGATGNGEVISSNML